MPEASLSAKGSPNQKLQINYPPPKPAFFLIKSPLSCLYLSCNLLLQCYLLFSCLLQNHYSPHQIFHVTCCSLFLSIYLERSNFIQIIKICFYLKFGATVIFISGEILVIGVWLPVNITEILIVCYCYLINVLTCF